jgi:hypothetical protein
MFLLVLVHVHVHEYEYVYEQTCATDHNKAINVSALRPFQRVEIGGWKRKTPTPQIFYPQTSNFKRILPMAGL